MTAVSVTAQNTRLDDAENATQWGNIGGGAGGALETDFVYQGSNCFARKGGTAQRGIFMSDDVDSDLSGAGSFETVLLKFICTTPGLLDLLSVPGMRLEIGSGSVPATPSGDFHFYDVQGSDTYPLSASWLVIAIDPNIASHRSGTTGTPDLTLVDYFGLRYDQIGTSKAANQAMDAVDIGNGLTLVGGDGADPDGVWQDFLDHDEGTAANRFGYARSNEGIFFILGMMVIGSATATVFNDEAVTVIFVDGLFAAGWEGITVDLASATTDVDFVDSTFIGNGTEAGEDTRPVLTVTGTSGACDVLNCVFDNFADLTLTSAVTLQDSTIKNSESIQQNGAVINNCIIFGATTADGVAFIISDDPGLIDLCDFTFSDGHAIEITATGTYEMDGNVYTGYGADGTNDAAIYNNSGGLVTLNITNGANPTIRNGAGASTVLNNNITATVTVNDEAGAAIVGAQVSVRLDSDNSEILGGATNGSGVVTGSVAAGLGGVSVRVRKGSGGGTDYIPIRSPQTVGSGDFNVTITMTEDPINAN